MLGVSLLLLGVLAGEGATVPLQEASVSNNNGTITVAYPIPAYPYEEAVLEVEYAFPVAPGDAYLVNCIDHTRLVEGRPIEGPAVRREDMREGSFTSLLGREQGWPSTRYYRLTDATEPAMAGSGSSASGGGGTSIGSFPRGTEYCTGVLVAFQWEASSPEAWQENRPDASVVVREMPLEGEMAGALFALAILGGASALAGGLAWGRQRDGPRAPSDLDEAAGAAETLRVMAERAEAWLARTRRYVLISGPLGIFLWYPVLIPWAWRAGREGSTSAWMPWALATGALLFLAGLTLLWAREFLRLDRELAAWREQLAELKRREDALMAELSA